MTNKSHLLILLTILIVSFPSICFSKSKTIEGEYCDVYLGDLKNKKELEKVRKSVSFNTIKNCLNSNMLDDGLKGYILLDECIINIKDFFDKIEVISHTEKGRKICEKVKINYDPEVILKFVNHSDKCPKLVPVEYDPFMAGWVRDIDDLLKINSNKMNIGLIIDTKIENLQGNKRELLENDEENKLFSMIEWNKEKYQFVDRRHLGKVLEEQKLSSSGITDTETVKLGKILNLNIIVLRIIYKNSTVTKVLKVDTGEVLLFKKYETEKDTEDEWVYLGETISGMDYYYNKELLTSVDEDIKKVWTKEKFSEVKKNNAIKNVNNKKKTNGNEIDPLVRNILLESYLETLIELDCRSKTVKEIKKTLFNYKNEIIKSTDFTNPKIQQISPQTMDSVLLKKICP